MIWQKLVVSFPQTHSGSVWRVTWAHPEFGQVLASCSFDRTAAVWEEIVGESNDKQRGQSHWVSKQAGQACKNIFIFLFYISLHFLCGVCSYECSRLDSPDSLYLFKAKESMTNMWGGEGDNGRWDIKVENILFTLGDFKPQGVRTENDTLTHTLTWYLTQTWIKTWRQREEGENFPTVLPW